MEFHYWMFAVIFFAYCLQTLTGFGASILSMAVISLVIPLEQLVPALAIITTVFSIVVLYQTRDGLNSGFLMELIRPMGIGVIVGVALASLLSYPVVQIVVMSVIFLSLLLERYATELSLTSVIKKYRFPLRVWAGIMQGSSVSGGPLLLLTLLGSHHTPQVLRATLACIWGISSTVIVGMGVLRETFDQTSIAWILCSVSAGLLGYAVGSFLIPRVSRKAFDSLTYWSLLGCVSLSLGTLITRTYSL